jgi:signal transduction histidine kinase
MPKTNWPDTRNRDTRILIFLWMSSLLLLLATVLHVYLLDRSDRDREVAVAERQLSNLTRVSQEHANRTLQSADQVIRFVQSRYLEVGAKLNLQDLTAKGVIDTQIFNQVGIIDAEGIYSLSNLPITQKMDLSDREHFRVHVGADSGEMFISKPLLGRASGKWSIQLTRRINRPDGSFAGVVVVSIDPGYFTRFYADLDLGAQGLAALYGMDGVARARMVGAVSDYGADASKSRLFGLIEGGMGSGSYTQRSVVDGLERLFFYRKVPGFPLVVVAGTEVRYLLADHNASREALFLQAGLLSLLIVSLAVTLTYYLKKIREETASRHLAEEQSQRRAVQLNAIFAMSPDGFVTFDERGQIQYVNPAFGRMTSTAVESLQGMDERDFSAWLSSRCTPAAAFQGFAKMRARSGLEGSRAYEVIEMAGPEKRLLQLGLLQSDSESVPLILYFRDVTQEMEVDRMKSEFLSTAAHELRTPMASIYGFVEILLSDGGLNPTQQEYLEIVDRQSKLMVHILNDLLDLARIEARRGIDFKYTEFPVQALLHSIVQAFPLPAQRSHIRLNMPEGPIVLSADEGKLRQVMVNILTNAYKFSARGQDVELDLERCQEDGVHMVCIHVRDHGIGMTPEQLEHVFVRFYRAEASGSVPGTGLGMSIVKEIVELHGGRIALQSAPGEGTRVSVRLPLLAGKPGAAS